MCCCCVFLRFVNWVDTKDVQKCFADALNGDDVKNGQKAPQNEREQVHWISFNGHIVYVLYERMNQADCATLYNGRTLETIRTDLWGRTNAKWVWPTNIKLTIWWWKRRSFNIQKLKPMELWLCASYSTLTWKKNVNFCWTNITTQQLQFFSFLILIFRINVEKLLHLYYCRCLCQKKGAVTNVICAFLSVLWRWSYVLCWNYYYFVDIFIITRQMRVNAVPSCKKASVPFKLEGKKWDDKKIKEKNYPETWLE